MFNELLQKIVFINLPDFQNLADIYEHLRYYGKVIVELIKHKQGI